MAYPIDLVPYVSAAQDFFYQNPLIDTVVALGVGGLAANPIKCADICSKVVAKIPPLRYVISRNWPAINDFIDKFQERFGQDVKADEEPAAPPAPAPVPPPAPPAA